MSAIYNYEADYFINNIIASGTAIPARIVNQSFIAVTSDNAVQEEVEQIYDDYAASYNTLFISGVGNGGRVYAPGPVTTASEWPLMAARRALGQRTMGVKARYHRAGGCDQLFHSAGFLGAAAILLQAARRGDACLDRGRRFGRAHP